MMRWAVLVVFSCAMVAFAPGTGRAAEPLYESRLVRLSEILGSLHFLRNLCGDEGMAWRREMEGLLEVENPDPARRARLVAAFNNGYRAYDATYTVCTSSATEAIARYMREGEALSREIAVRFGD